MVPKTLRNRTTFPSFVPGTGFVPTRRHYPVRTSPRLLLDSLKSCPLCEAVNGEASAACVVCGWTGAFDRDADDLQASFDALVAQCPELATKPRGGKWWSRMFLRMRAAF